MTEHLRPPGQHRQIGGLPVADIPVSHEMGLPTAQRILQVVMGTHERTFETRESFTSVGEYSVAQVSEAIEIVGDYRLKKDPASNVLPSFRMTTLSRAIPDRPGAHSVFYLKTETPKTGISADPARFAELQVVQNFSGNPAFQIPLNESAVEIIKDSPFIGFREGKRKTPLSKLQDPEGFAIDDARHVWRGYRWLAANLLAEEGQYIAPEDLDGNQLTQS